VCVREEGRESTCAHARASARARVRLRLQSLVCVWCVTEREEERACALTRPRASSSPELCVCMCVSERKEERARVLTRARASSSAFFWRSCFSRMHVVARLRLQRPIGLAKETYRIGKRDL